MWWEQKSGREIAQWNEIDLPYVTLKRKVGDGNVIYASL